jgi:CMP-N-acetylneuraminic acid synthetase/spore coat polysaccharide biosynthesis predicted glycosyltransferase SpsG
MLAVVPARGGSQAIKRKNLSLIDGKPLLCHIADTLTGHRVIVSTDDVEITSVARVHGYEVVRRPSWLAEDDVPVSVVARHVCEQVGWSGPVLVAQPTCPYVTRQTIDALIAQLDNHAAATLITANTHLLRGDGPLTERVNRQELTGVYSEVGVRVFRNSSHLDDYPTGTVEVSGREAMDIDTVEDLAAARQTPRRVRFRTTANKAVGSGHLRRCLLLANELQHHDISLELVDSDSWAERMSPWPSWGPADLIINDTLDTTDKEMAVLKSEAPVVTFEDLGPGARLADLVVNALYPMGSSNERSGPRWADLRPEFCGLPSYQIRDTGRILVMFGGTDPAELGGWVHKIYPDATWVQPGDDVSVAAEMMAHDLLITSAGRTVYEAAAVGIPSVVLAQNPREATHVHLGKGNVYLGLGQLVEYEHLTRTVASLLEHSELRRQLSETGGVDGLGAARIVHAVEGILGNLG